MADPVTDPVAEHDARYGEEGAGARPPGACRVAWFTTTRRAWTRRHGTRSTEKDGLDLGAETRLTWGPRRCAADLLLPGSDFWAFDDTVVVFNALDRRLRHHLGARHAARPVLAALTPVTVSSPSSSAQAARQALGARLRELRVEAGLTARALGQLMERHPSKISRIEHGSAQPSADDIRAWCKHCGAADQIPDLIASLRAVEGMWIEWRRLERSGLRQAQESMRPLMSARRVAMSLLRDHLSSVVPARIDPNKAGRIDDSCKGALPRHNEL
jgi:transcriptional regulator with XRE-family HTH domain